MREIKFRGLNEETGEWVYGWYTKLVEGIRRFDAIIADVDGELTRFYIHNKETIGQFTGLHDKNGKEIYEGDVIRSKNHRPEKMEIRFLDGGFCAWWGSDDYPIDINHFYDSKGCCIEVIGNIHEQQS